MTIEVTLSDHAIQRLRQRAGPLTVEAYIEAHLEGWAAAESDPLIGAFADDADLLDQIVAEAMANRHRPSPGEERADGHAA